MPETASGVPIKTLKTERHEDYKDNIDLWIKWRAAMNSNLGGRKLLRRPKLSRVKARESLELIEEGMGTDFSRSKRQFLYRLSHLESDTSFFFRQLHNIDFGDSEKVVRIYSGHSVKNEPKLDLGITDEVDKKIIENIDNMGNPLRTFAQFVFDEIYGMGKAIVFSNAPRAAEGESAGSVLPWASLIKRENLLDWALDETVGDGSLRYAKWQVDAWVDSRFSRQKVRQIWAVDRDELIILQESKKGSYEILDRIKNHLGRVPVRIATMGQSAIPVIETVCEIQVALMNCYSVMAQLLRNQALAILVLPKGANVDQLTSTSRVEVPPGAGGDMKWMGYPDSTLKPHFENINFLIERMRDLSNLREKGVNMAEAALSKKWDFLDTETVLSVGVKAHDKIMSGVFQDFAALSGRDSEPVKYTNNDDFNYLSAKEKLEQAQIVEVLPLGETAKTEYFKAIRDLVVTTLDQQGIKKSDEEITAAIENTANMGQAGPAFDTANLANFMAETAATTPTDQE